MKKIQDAPRVAKRSNEGVSCVNTVISANVPTTMSFAILDALTVALVSAQFAIARFACAKRNPRVIGREVLTIGNKPHEVYPRALPGGTGVDVS